jgi:hypothetical protein
MGVRVLRRFLSYFLALVLAAGAAPGQTPRADKIRKQVGKIGVLGNITVSVIGGTDYYGSVSRIDADDFSINEVDQRREVTLRYSEVKRVRADYGTTRNIRGQHIHPSHEADRDAGGGGRAAGAGVHRGGFGQILIGSPYS